jgi:hypothetical protein
MCPLSKLANSSPDIEVTFLRAFLEQLSLADPDFLRTIRYLITPQNVEEVLGWEGNPMDARQITVESIPLTNKDRSCEATILSGGWTSPLLLLISSLR